jgi:hypothetical protein
MSGAITPPPIQLHGVHSDSLTFLKQFCSPVRSSSCNLAVTVRGGGVCRSFEIKTCLSELQVCWDVMIDPQDEGTWKLRTTLV